MPHTQQSPTMEDQKIIDELPSNITEPVLTEKEEILDEKSVKYRHPVKPSGKPVSRPGCNRDAARLWRKKKLLNGLKSPSGKSSGGKLFNELSNPRNIPKPRKEPLPMCKRALPESFWQQPSTIQTNSFQGNTYSVLPPLFSSENNNTEDMTEIRPVTPPEERSSNKEREKRSSRYMTAPPDTELLNSLFYKFEKHVDERLIVRRGRPKKIVNDNQIQIRPPKHKDDPYMVDALSDTLFPQLSIGTNGNNLPTDGVKRFAVIKLPSGGNTIELPAIQLERNYPNMLDELAMRL